MANEKSSLTFRAIGTFGLEAAVGTDGYAYIRTPLDKKHGRPSQTGKMILSGSTGGFAALPDAEGLKVNVSAGWTAKGA